MVRKGDNEDGGGACDGNCRVYGYGGDGDGDGDGDGGVKVVMVRKGGDEDGGAVSFGFRRTWIFCGLQHNVLIEVVEEWTG
ncbi:Hypothetical predicted protein [Olea europaea subsp. europaea]|uniref:Uncharacterized protein n=1 Tax=Olea europaea subsp. europaea TaxID=158383 RepID=A0A8S0PZ31_OLEEU|nr:Hypothetical predicted protein [Olea europaea subsp. europaea]